MLKIKTSRFFSISILFVLLSLPACSAKTPEQKTFGPDADYFAGLQFLEQGRTTEAVSKFQHCVKKGTYFCAKKSAEELCNIGDIQQKNQAVINLVENFRDSDTLLIAARQLYSTKEISKLISITENMDFVTEKNETIKYRLQAMKDRKDSRYESEVFKWFTCCPISDVHYQFYRDVLDHPDFGEEDVIFTPKDFVINYRIELYRRNYTYTFNNAATILEYLSDGTVPVLTQLASDIGKSYLYASNQYARNAQYFKKLAADYHDTELAYYFWFYAGRFYDKAGNYFEQTKSCFNKAIKCANTDSQKDDALWYLLDISRNFSVDTLIKNIGNYSKEWKDPFRFENFFESLISPLLASGKWQSFYDIYTAIDGYASDETVAQFAYIYGRLCKTGFAKGTEEQMQEAFTRALKSGSSFYYRILAAYELKLSPEDFTKALAPTAIYAPIEKNQAAEQLLLGYASFGFPQYIYENYMKLYKEGISTDTAFYLSEFLNRCAVENESYYTQSLRIAARAAFYGDRPLSKEELKLIYPQNYKKLINEYCSKYDMNPSIMFALVRSESFFDSQVISSAGAIGLTQLMDFTGADIARRFKKPEFDLTDAATNLEFGTWYLNNLYERTENSYLQAFFSYNAGITRVRKWLQGSMIEFGLKSKMPGDLFLETVPYTETREYGRKLVSATVMYDFLYNVNSDFTKSIEELLY